MTPRRALTVAVVVLCTLSACAVGSEDDATAPAPVPQETGGTPTSRSTPSDTTGGTTPPEVPVPELVWSSCSAGMSCATLPVPLDWSDPESPMIDLAVGLRPATGDPDDRMGVLAINPGGPGGSGLSLLEAAGAMSGLRELNRSFDLVSWDPRGVGDSTALVCDATLLEAFRTLDPDPDAPGEQEALDAAAAAYADDCVTGSPELVGHLGTAQTVEDLDHLRAALGEPQLSWLGFSYGTYLGQAYAEAHPDRVRAMVLDGVVDPADGLEGLLAAQAVGFDTQLEALFAECDVDPSCPIDDPAAVWDGLVERVETDPLPAGAGSVGPAELATAWVASVYDASLSQQLLRALARAEVGDGTMLAGLAQTYWGFGDYPAYLATLCADLEHPAGADEALGMAERLADVAPGAGAAVANEILPCAWLPVEGPAAAPITASGAPTILVIGNTGDVATPVENAERVAAQLDDAVLLVHEGTGHTSFNSSECVQEVVVAYLVDLVVPDEGTVCSS